MANNRMYIVCRKCEGFMALAKTMGDGWYSRGTINLNDFFEEHDHVRDLENGFGSKQFALVFEADDPQVEMYNFETMKIKLTKLQEVEVKE